MASVNFYALKEDMRQLVQFLFEETDVLNLRGSRSRYQAIPFVIVFREVGLIQLYLGGQHQSTITDFHFGHWNEAGARQRGARDPDTVDWNALSQLSGRIERHLRNKLGVAKVRGRPILRAAFAAVQGGLGCATVRYDFMQIHQRYCAG